MKREHRQPLWSCMIFCYVITNEYRKLEEKNKLISVYVTILFSAKFVQHNITRGYQNILENICEHSVHLRRIKQLMTKWITIFETPDKYTKFAWVSNLEVEIPKVNFFLQAIRTINDKFVRHIADTPSYFKLTRQ